MGPTNDPPLSLGDLRKLKDQLVAIVRPGMADIKAAETDEVKRKIMKQLSPSYLKLQDVKRKIAELKQVKKAATDSDLGGVPPIETAGSDKPDVHATPKTTQIPQENSAAADAPANSQANAAADAKFDAPPDAHKCSEQSRHSPYFRFTEDNSILEAQGDHVMVLSLSEASDFVIVD